eukprot:scaffold647569_cov19-Prasinocladus_malaysianus.AAC.1
MIQRLALRGTSTRTRSDTAEPRAGAALDWLGPVVVVRQRTGIITNLGFHLILVLNRNCT